MGGLGGGLEMDGGGGHDYGGGNGGAHAAAAVALTGDGFENSKEYTLGLFPCVRLSGLAATTSVNDVMMFFTGLGPVLDIVLDPARSGGGDGGEQTLDAVVLFGNMMDYHGALQRYSLQLLGRYVEVAPALRGDYYAAIMQRDASASHDDDNVEQQPAAPSPQDASQAASAAAAGGAPSVVANGGSAGGEAAATPTAAAGAAAGAAPAAGAKAAAAGAAAAAAGGADGGGKGPVTVIRMRGLPYRASKADIMAFFQGCAVAEVNFVARADGRVTGEAYVKFASREDARQGLRRDRDMIGNRYIELFTSSPEEMARYLKRHS
ncbi:hypothetical protein JKP88DRAFT_203579 [Tribonema minus]|uniref:RRM domain-containing protein n=1 Tax=Tribonema minus TaxID=303371 RepID=A0A835YKV5_9STRA|nr:hypothetical protein JKP88DRAFT_203579 [Tribonema minus]